MLGWTRQLSGLMVGVAALVILFSSTIGETLAVWSHSEAYRFLYLVLPISLYVIWLRRARVARIEPKLRLWPLLPLAGFAALWLLSKSAFLLVGEQVAFVGMLQCLLLIFLGGRVYVALLFPFLFLWLMVPIGDQIMPQLMSLTVTLAKLGYHLMGRAMTSDGTLLITAAGRYSIVEACSSLPFIIGNLIIALVFANLNFRRFSKQAAFVVASVPLAIFANILRIDTVVLITELTDKRINLVHSHILYGWCLFAGLVVIEILVGMRFSDPRAAWADMVLREPRFTRRQSRRRLVAAALVASLAVMGGARAWEEQTLRQASNTQAEDCSTVPLFGGSWDHHWQPVFLGADRVARGQIEVSGKLVDVFIAYYATEALGRELVGWPNGSADRKHWAYLETVSANAVNTGHLPPPMAERLRGANRSRRLVWTWYWTGGRFTGSPLRAKFDAALSRLKGHQLGSAALLLSVQGPLAPKEAAKTLVQSLKALGDPQALMRRVGRSACVPPAADPGPNVALETAGSGPGR